MEGRMKIVMVIAAVVSLIGAAVALQILTQGHGSGDYQATYDEFDLITKSGDNKVVYQMPSVWGYPDDDVSFADCAFSLEVNGTPLPPVNLHMNQGPGLFGSPPWEAYAQMSKGAGPFNSVTFIDGNVSYIVTFDDVDSDGKVTLGDRVTVECTKPLTIGTSYAVSVFVDIDGTWGIGKVFGTFQN